MHTGVRVSFSIISIIILCQYGFSQSQNLAYNRIAMASEKEDPENNHMDWLVNGALTDKAAGVHAQQDGSAFIGVDLCKSFRISRVRIFWDDFCYATGYSVQVSESLEGPYTTVFATSEGNAGIDDISFSDIQTRFVKVLILQHNGNAWGVATIKELEVYGDGGSGIHTSMITEISGRPVSPAEVEITWTAVGGAAGYVIRKDDIRIIAAMDTSAQRVVRDVTGLEIGHEYEVFVVDENGNIGYQPATNWYGPEYDGSVLSRFKNVSASHIIDLSRWFPPEYRQHPGSIVSNNPMARNMAWCSGELVDGQDEWVMVDLGGEATVNEVTTVWNGYHGAPAAYHIEVSTDGNTWQKVRDGTGVFSPVSARFVRVVITAGDKLNMACMQTLEVMGESLVVSRFLPFASSDYRIPQTNFNLLSDQWSHETVFRCNLPYSQHVSIDIYRADGRFMARPISAVWSESNREFGWYGLGQANGAYIAKLSAATMRNAQKMYILK